MKKPTVSVLIPTYNYARYLPEAIDSVLAQDFDDFELIIADDASSDNTVEVCEAYARLDSRIRFFRHEENLGMVENWNWCLRQAKGTYIKYLLADDKFLKPYALRRLVEAIEQHVGISLVTSARALIDENSKITGVWNPLGLRSRNFSGKKLIRKSLIRGVNLVGEPTAVLFRRESTERGFDVKYRQLVDLEMWFHLLQHGDLAYIRDPLCCFRRHVNQQTAHNRKIDCHLSETKCLFDQYGDRDIAGRFVIKRIHVLRKMGNPGHAELIKDLRKQISRLQFVGLLIRYRLTKPFLNLAKSVNQHLCTVICLNNVKSTKIQNG